MIKAIITEAQEALIRGGIPLLLDVGDSVHKPFSDDTIFNRLVSLGFEHALSAFKDNIQDIPTDRVEKETVRVLSKIIDKEKTLRPQLEEICYRTVVSMLFIPDDAIRFEIDLVDEIGKDISFHIDFGTDEEREYASIDDMDEEKGEVEKRFVVNILTEGASEYCVEKALRKCINEIFELDEELPHLYSKYLKLNNYLLFKKDVKITDKEPHQGGYTEVYVNPNEEYPTVSVKAICFPILLYETFKGILQLVSTKGLPENMDSARYIVDNADILSQEPWNMRMGYALWKRSIGDKIDIRDIPYFIAMIIQGPHEDFLKLMKEVAYATKKGKETMRGLLDKVVHDRKYDDFTNDLENRKPEKTLVDEINGEFMV